MRPNLGVLRSAVGPMLTEAGTIERQDGTTLDPDGYEIPNMVTVFAGPVIVRPEAPVRSFDVTFPAESDVVIGDLLTLTDCPFDAVLIGQPIRITDVRHDSWQVALFATGKLDGPA